MSLSAAGAAAAPAAAPTLTASWHARRRERALLSSLLRSDRAAGSPLLVVGPAGGGKRSVVLDVLVERGSHFAFVSGLHCGGGGSGVGAGSAGAGQERQILNRVTAQLRDPSEGPRLFRQLCVAPPREEEVDVAKWRVAKARAADRACAAAANAGDDAESAIDVDADDGMDDAEDAAATTSPRKPGRPGRKKRKLDGSDADPATASSAIAGAATAAVHQKAQLTELVRTLGSMLLQHSKTVQNANPLDHPPAPRTFFLVLEHPARLAESSPGLLASLLRLRDHTGYPVTLVLLAPAARSSDGSSEILSLPQGMQEDFVRIRFPPYTKQQQGEIIGKKLWQENRFVQAAFERRPVASSAAVDSPPSAAVLSARFACFQHFVEHVVDMFHASLVSSSLREAEHLVRCILPSWLRAMSRRVGKNDSSVAWIASAAGATTTAAPSMARDARVATLTASVLEELRPVVRALMASAFRHDESALINGDVFPPASAAPARANAAGSSSASSALASPRAAPAAASSSSSISCLAQPLVPSFRAQLGLPLPSNDPSSALSTGALLARSLSRTAKLLLVASFVGSYNRPGSDTSLFAPGAVHRGPNRRGKSAFVARARKESTLAANAKQSGQEIALGQLQVGPNACTLERLLAIFQVVAGDEIEANDDGNGLTVDLDGEGRSGGLPSMAACYQQLNSLIGAHLLEQLGGCGGGGGGLGSSARARSSGAPAKGADLLSGVKVRCLLSLRDMEAICDTISTKRGATTGASGAAGGAQRMGDKFDLSAWLQDKR